MPAKGRDSSIVVVRGIGLGIGAHHVVHDIAISTGWRKRAAMAFNLLFRSRTHHPAITVSLSVEPFHSRPVPFDTFPYPPNTTEDDEEEDD